MELFLEAKGDPEQLKTFVNLQVGETWEERSGEVDAKGLAARRDEYPAEVPAGVGILTASADIHDDRIEVLVKGWGHREE